MRRGGSTGKSGEKGGRIMADRRMLAKAIVTSDAFLDMPAGARALYMLLSVRADDDGFVGSPKAIVRESSATEDDLKLLIIKKFIIAFDNGVVAIKHWHINNTIRKDTRKPTTYKNELAQLELDENNSYRFRDETVTNALQPRNEHVTNTLRTRNEPVTKPRRTRNETETQYNIIQDNIRELCIDSPRASEETPETGVKTHLFEIPTVEKVTAYCKTKGYTIDAERFIAWGERTEWCINGQRIRSWQSVADAWQKRAQSKEPQTYTESSFDVDEFLDAALTASRCR